MELTEAASQAKYPALQPIGVILDTGNTSTAEIVEIGGVSMLKNRASSIAGPVVDPATKTELSAAIDRHSAL